MLFKRGFPGYDQKILAKKKEVAILYPKVVNGEW